MSEDLKSAEERWIERVGGSRVPLTPSVFPGDAVAIIYKPARSAMTSGKARTRQWKLRFEPRSSQYIEPLMAWTGRDDTLSQVELTFPSVKAAVAYARRQGLQFMVQGGAAAAASVVADSAPMLDLDEAQGSAAVKAPGFGDRRKAMLQDIAILTGGNFISEDIGTKLENVTLNMLGRAKKVVIDKESTTIVSGAGKKACGTICRGEPPGIEVTPRGSARGPRAMGLQLRIAQIAPLYERVQPKLYGGTERVVSYLTEELVRQGHDVTLFASGDSKTSAKLVRCCDMALRLNPSVREPLVYHVIMLEEATAADR
jgi:hypothetical protein